MIYSFIKECAAIDLRLLCLNYMECRKDIKEIISHAEGKLVVVDSADILLKIYLNW